MCIQARLKQHLFYCFPSSRLLLPRYRAVATLLLLVRAKVLGGIVSEHQSNEEEGSNDRQEHEMQQLLKERGSRRLELVETLGAIHRWIGCFSR